MHAEYDIMIGYTDLVNNIQCNANHIRPSLTDTILKVMAYIIAYSPIRAEPYQVWRSVSIAKSIGKTLITMTPSIQVSNRLVEQLEPYPPLSQLSQGPRPQTDQPVRSGWAAFSLLPLRAHARLISSGTAQCHHCFPSMSFKVQTGHVISVLDATSTCKQSRQSQ
jgi:hypothetical protein